MTSPLKKRTFLLLPPLLLLGVVSLSVVRSVRMSRADEDEISERLDARRSEAPRKGALSTRRELPQDGNVTDVSRPDASRPVSEDVEPTEEQLGELAAFGSRNGETVGFPHLSWKPGDAWKVESFYLQQQAGEKPAWMEKPIVWQFQVRAIERFEGEEVYAVDVEPSDLTDMPYNPGGTIYVSTKDHSIAAVKDTVLEQGALRGRLVRFDEAVGGAFSALFPTELPSPGSEARRGDTTRGTLAPHPFRPDPIVEAPACSGRVIDVSFESNGVTIRQRWDAADLRWPLHSRTPSRVSYLKKNS